MGEGCSGDVFVDEVNVVSSKGGAEQAGDGAVVGPAEGGKAGWKARWIIGEERAAKEDDVLGAEREAGGGRGERDGRGRRELVEGVEGRAIVAKGGADGG